MTKISVAIKSALLAGAALTATTASASDKDLLEALLQNGVLNKAQFEKLSKKADEKEAASSSASLSPEMAKALDWASRIKISGDMRVRQEFVDNEADGKKNRQRIRARLALKAKVNDEVEAGVRLVTAGGRTSTNQSLGDGAKGTDGFKGKAAYFDRAYIKWKPAFAKGASLTAGKFKMPWFRVSDNLWDGDVNPEGLALAYSNKAGPVKLTAQGGYYILSDNGDEGNTYSEDMNMYHAGLSGAMKFNDAVKASLGFNAFLVNDGNGSTTNINRLAGDHKNGNNTTSSFKIYEVAGKVDIKTGILPVKLYGNYVVNAGDTFKKAVDTDRDSQDTAWLVGIGTKWNKFKLDYNYRDTQRDAVMDTFNDSDFNRGGTAARGHKVKLSYKLSKNFSIGGAYLAAEDYSTAGETINRDTLQLDLKAKF